jgi:hypothetical protein
MKTRKTIQLIFVVLMVCILTVPITSASSSKIWKDKLKEIFNSWAVPANSDKEMLKNNTYEKLRTFFGGCDTPWQFYDRVNKCVLDSMKGVPSDLPMLPALFGPKLSDVVDCITDEDASLWCYHQVWLLAGGIKAMFSYYDETKSTYVLNDGCGDFKLEVYRSIDLHRPIFPWRSHVQMVVDMWNGTDTFVIDNKTVDKIEIDTWEGEYREFDKWNDCLFYPFFPAKLNSLFYTKDV